ncbi:MAG TPA: dethiobiotin synthase [Polyangiaceae bacterium]|nr:dethiobiotin synthase [Polyangiaceae bacterium]
MRIVVLGTGTDVGKTYVTACLARGLAEHRSVLALKPIESGVDPHAPGDAGTIAAAAGHAPLHSRWRFEPPVSPHLAARMAGTSIDPAQVAQWVADQERFESPEVTIVELAGGALSPLAADVTNVELALGLGPAVWLLVAPDSLGVLHDLTATLRCLPRPPDAVVLSRARPADASTGTNALELQRLGIAEVLEVIPEGATSCPGTVAWLLGR